VVAILCIVTNVSSVYTTSLHNVKSQCDIIVGNMSFQTLKPPCSAIENRAGCMQATLSILGDKWTPLLLGQLVEGQKTFGELETMLAGISPRTLSARLIKLEDVEIIIKNKYNEHPPRYKYELTAKGQELQAVLQNMANWGEKYQASC